MSFLSGEKLTDALFDGYPSLREWRSYRIGLIAALTQIACWFALFCDVDLHLGVSFRVPEAILVHVHTSLLLAFAACLPIATLGLLLDKSKVLSAGVLGSAIPAFMLLIMWSGRW